MYYVNHKERRTTWTDPREMQMEKEEEENTGFSIWCSSKKFDDLLSCITEKLSFGKKETEKTNEKDKYMCIEKPYAFRLNCVLIGESGVGKSSICKILMGGIEKEIYNELKQNFGKICHFKPNSSRKESSELYIICQDFNRKHISKKI